MMERNPALKIFAVLRRLGPERVIDSELRKATGLTQVEIDVASEELESEGMILVERTYTLAE